MLTTKEPIRDIAHLGHVELLTPKPNESLWYFHDILGMEQVHAEDQSVYFELYNLENDPNEMDNIVLKEPGIFNEFREVLEAKIAIYDEGFK